MKSFNVIFSVLLGVLNLVFFMIFFDLEKDIIKLIMSELSVLTTTILVATVLAKNVHEAFKLSLVFVLPFFGTAQLIISYFMYSEFKYNVFILLWLLMLIIQVILVAVSSFIKPRP